MLAKRCSKCGLDKPVDDFYYNTRESLDGPVKYPRGDCKSCNNAAGRQRFAERYLSTYREKRIATYAANLRLNDFWRARTRARRRGATQCMSLEEWETLRSSKSCHWCGLELHPSFTNVDHVVPLSEGGQHTVENVVMACANCNMKREWERKTIHLPTPVADSEPERSPDV